MPKRQADRHCADDLKQEAKALRELVDAFAKDLLSTHTMLTKLLHETPKAKPRQRNDKPKPLSRQGHLSQRVAREVTRRKKLGGMLEMSDSDLRQLLSNVPGNHGTHTRRLERWGRITPTDKERSRWRLVDHGPLVLDLVRAHLTTKQISTTTGLSDQEIRMIARRAGLKPAMPKRPKRRRKLPT